MQESGQSQSTVSGVGGGVDGRTEGAGDEEGAPVVGALQVLGLQGPHTESNSSDTTRHASISENPKVDCTKRIFLKQVSPSPASDSSTSKVQESGQVQSTDAGDGGIVCITDGDDVCGQVSGLQAEHSSG